MSRGLFRKISLGLAAVGPGLFLIGYNIGTGSVTTMAKSGAEHGMSLFWTLVLSCIFTYVLMVAYGQVTLVTGKTALANIRRALPFGRLLAIYIMVALILGELLALMGIMGIVSDLLNEGSKMMLGGDGISRFWIVLVCSVVLYLILWYGRYRLFEKLLTGFVILMVVCFSIVFVLVKPSLSAVVQGLVPRIPDVPGSFGLIAAMAGTTCSAAVFIIRSIVVTEKGWTVDDLKSEKRDAAFSAGTMLLLSGLIMAVSAGTLSVMGLKLNDSVDMIRLFEPLGGRIAAYVLILGIAGAGISTVFPIILIAPWLICDYTGRERNIRSPLFRILGLVGILFAFGSHFLSQRPPAVMIFSQAFQACILPAVVLPIFFIINSRRIMGKFVAKRLMNIGLTAVLLFSIVTTYLAIAELFSAETSAGVSDWTEDLASEDALARDEAVQSLVACGPQAINALAGALEDERESVRRQAAITLGRLGPDASGAIAALTTVLEDDSDETVRRAAAVALASIGGEGIDILAKALRSDNEIVGRAAVSALLSIGTMARPAIGELTGALAHEDSQIRLDSARALGRMGGQARSATVALGRMLETSGDKTEIWVAAGALARLGPAAVASLSGSLESDDIRVRSAAAVALAATGPSGNAVLAENLTPEDIPGLVEIFQCEDMQMLWWVAHALEIIGPSAVPAMSEALITGEDSVQLAVLGALIRMRKDSGAAVAALIEVLDDENRQVRRYAIYTLLHIGPGARSAVPAIVNIMKTTDDDMMCHPATRFLGGFGPEVAFVTGDLINALRRDHPAITRVAGNALSRMGPAAIPALVEGLGDEHPEVRCGCAMALSQMETDTTDVLLEVLASGDDLARAAAADTFGRMGPSAIGVTGALERILNDENEDRAMRSAAKSALRRIILDGQNPAAPAVAASGEPADIAPGDRLRAFPGAEGFGAFSVGGRGGRVIMVTNLYDSGPGSFRAACEAAGPRIVVFRVSGVIELQSPIDILEPFITIAGQSAPGGGICVKNYRFMIMDTHDVIVRYLRFRKGDLARDVSSDVLDVRDSYNVIVDHCSMSWGTDETVSSSGDLDMTIQWCMITESLPDGWHVEKTHGKGSLFTGDRGGISLHHNIYAHHERRTPRVGGRSEDMPGIVLDCRNNVIYNWGDMSGQSTTCPVKVNYVGNYLKPGNSTWPESRGFAFYPGGPLTGLFVADNVIEGYPDKDADNWQMVSYDNGGSQDQVKVNTPFDVPLVHTEAPRSASRSVLKDAGAVLPARDAVDARIVADIRDGTGQLVDSQWWVGGWPYYRQIPPSADSDYDGMPDAWERKHGLDPNDPDDNCLDADSDGYTNIEQYLNSIMPAAPATIATLDK